MTKVRGRYDDYDNVLDFIELFLSHHAERMASMGREDLADNLYDALDRYLLGDVDIYMRDGMPVLVTRQLPAIAEEIDDA